MGENAGVVDAGDGWAVTFKIESHNHPSYVEPYQGAATGVGGIVRDILTMGARPIAVMDSLRFGRARRARTPRACCPASSPASAATATASGLPNIGGEVCFDECYTGNPLVNALCVGVMRTDGIKLAKADGPGNKVVLFGARTGGDGIGGASVLASATFDDSKPSKRPSVQVGDPFAEKVLIECCLEIFAADLVVGIQDLGAAGLSCATTELAAAGTGGMDVDLDLVPLRDPTLAPEEILMSESQERMMAVVEPERLDEFLAVCAQVGRHRHRDRHRHRHRTAAHDLARRADRRPAAAHRRARGAGLRASDRTPARPGRSSTSTTAHNLPRPRGGAELGQLLMRMVASPNLCDRSWVTDQYDRFVLGNTVLAQPEDAGVIRLDESTERGIALAVDGNSRYTRLDPYAGAQLALAEAYRNVAVTGARPLAVTNCLNFGSPEDPAVMWQFAEAVRGLADGCQAARHAGHRRQRQLLQPDRHDPDPADAGDRRARRDRRRQPAACRPASPTTARRSSCWARPATSSAGRRGPTSCTASSADARRPSTSPARSVLADVLVAAARERTAQLGARPVRRRARAGAGRVVPDRRRRRARRPACRPRPVRRAVQRIGAPRTGLRPARPRRRVHRAVRRARPAVHAPRHGRRPRDQP